MSLKTAEPSIDDEPESLPTEEEIVSYIGRILKDYKSMVWKGWAPYSYNDREFYFFNFMGDPQKVERAKFRAGISDYKLVDGKRVPTPNWKTWYTTLYKIFTPIYEYLVGKDPNIQKE